MCSAVCVSLFKEKYTKYSLDQILTYIYYFFLLNIDNNIRDFDLSTLKWLPFNSSWLMSVSSHTKLFSSILDGSPHHQTVPWFEDVERTGDCRVGRCTDKHWHFRTGWKSCNFRSVSRQPASVLSRKADGESNF